MTRTHGKNARQRWYDGPGIVHWLEQEFGALDAGKEPAEDGLRHSWNGFNDNDLRTIRHWRSGDNFASERTLERVLTRLGRDTSEIPERLIRIRPTK